MCNIFVHSTIAFTISKYATMVGNDCESERNKIPPFFFSYEGNTTSCENPLPASRLFIFCQPFLFVFGKVQPL